MRASPRQRRPLQQAAKVDWLTSSRGVYAYDLSSASARADCASLRFLSRQIVDVTADWGAQQIVECCAWDRVPPRFFIHDRDSRYGANFDRRVRGLGIRQVRTPFRSPRANAAAERWVRSVRSECLDHLIVFNEANLRRVLSAYVTYYNRWRPHRSLGQAVP
jgi:transposase InsO family protein